jgi:hypothetical protein
LPSEILGELRAPLKEQDQQHRPDDRPVEPLSRGRHAEQVEGAPDRLLRSEVRVPCEGEESCRAEPARHVGLQRLAGSAPPVLLLLELILLLVCGGLEQERGDEETCSAGIEQVEWPRRAGRRDGGQRNEQQQQDLVERHEAEVEEPPAPGTGEQRMRAARPSDSPRHHSRATRSHRDARS